MPGVWDWLFGGDEPELQSQTNTSGNQNQSGTSNQQGYNNQSGSNTQTGSSTTTGSAQQMALIQALMPGLLASIGQAPQMPTGQSFVAGLTPAQQQAHQAAMAAATGSMTDQASQAAAANAFLMNPDILSPDSNPYLRDNMRAARRGITQNLMENILPGMEDTRIANGTLGGSRGALQNGIAAARTSGEIADSQAALASAAYGQGLGAMSGALGRAPTIQGMAAAPATLMGQVGAQQQAQNQAQLNEQLQTTMFNQQSPMNHQMQLLQMMGMLPGGSTSSSSTGTNSQSGQSGSTGASTSSGTSSGQSSTYAPSQGNIMQLLGLGLAGTGLMFPGGLQGGTTPPPATGTWSPYNWMQ